MITFSILDNNNYAYDMYNSCKSYGKFFLTYLFFFSLSLSHYLVMSLVSLFQFFSLNLIPFIVNTHYYSTATRICAYLQTKTGNPTRGFVTRLVLPQCVEEKSPISTCWRKHKLLIGFGCGRVTATDFINLRHVISHRSLAYCRVLAGTLRPISPAF